MSDPGLTYRTREEVAEIRKTTDPILQLRNIILDNRVATENDLKDIETQIRERIDKEVEQI